MRVAFSGSHRTGKSTLIDAIASALPGYQVIDEPYRVLEEAGHEFADPPTSDDYQAQLQTSLESLADAPTNALFDRCPLDLVAYALTVDDQFELYEWMATLRDALESIDLIVFVPIETPDRIVVSSHEDRQLRRRVDQRLQWLLLDDPFGFSIATVDVTGSIDARVAQVMRAIQRAA